MARRARLTRTGVEMSARLLRVLVVAVVLVVATACGTPVGTPLEAVPVERAVPPEAGEEPPSAAESPPLVPAIWPERLVVGVAPPMSAPAVSAIGMLSSELSERLGTRVTITARADHASLLADLLAARIDAAIIDPLVIADVAAWRRPRVVGQAIGADGPTQATAWHGLGAQRWCPGGVVRAWARPSVDVAACAGLVVDGVPAEAPVGGVAGIEQVRRIVYVAAQGEATHRLGADDLGAHLDDGYDEWFAQTLAIAQAMVAEPSETLVLAPWPAVPGRRINVEPVAPDAEEPVVVAWGPALPRDVVVVRRGIDGSDAVRIGDAFVEVAGQARGAAAMIDLLGHEGIVAADDGPMAVGVDDDANG
jgi:ABC-type phosphate/phosphonate transport system substrate-binding protein